MSSYHIRGIIVYIYLRQLNITSIILNLNFCQLLRIKAKKNKTLIKEQQLCQTTCKLKLKISI